MHIVFENTIMNVNLKSGQRLILYFFSLRYTDFFIISLDLIILWKCNVDAENLKFVIISAAG